MRQEHRLRRLDVGSAWQHRRPLAFGQPDERALELEQRRIEVVDRPTRPQSKVRGDLIVPRPAGVKPAGKRPDPADQGRLHVHVDVLEPGVPFERAGRRVPGEGDKALGEDADLVLVQEASSTEPADMRYRARDVVGGERFVDLDRACEISHPRVGVAAESPAPGPHRSSVVFLAMLPGARAAERGPARSRVIRRSATQPTVHDRRQAAMPEMFWATSPLALDATLEHQRGRSMVASEPASSSRYALEWHQDKGAFALRLRGGMHPANGLSPGSSSRRAGRPCRTRALPTPTLPRPTPSPGRPVGAPRHPPR